MTKLVAFVVGILVTITSVSSAQGDTVQFPQVPGWKLTVEEIVYTPDNLWDIIDGAADLFLEYNFVDLRIGRYQKSADLEIKVELYRHKSAVDAFGMYSQERYPDYHYIDLGTQGYSEKRILNFLCGEYYVKISTVQSEQPAQDALMSIGRALEQRLSRPKSWPGLLRAFPQQGREANSEQYVSRNFLGYSFFNGVFTANYGDGSTLKAFILRLGTPEEARKTTDTYLATIQKEGVLKAEAGHFRVRDAHSGLITFVLSGNTIYGVLGTEGKDSDALLAEFGKSIALFK